MGVQSALLSDCRDKDPHELTWSPFPRLAPPSLTRLEQVRVARAYTRNAGGALCASLKETTVSIH